MHSPPLPKSWLSSRGSAGSSGFTLIELIAAVAVIAIILGLVSIHVKGFSVEARWDAARHRIASAAKLARTRAASEGRPLVLRYDLGRGSVLVIDALQEEDRQPSAGHLISQHLRLRAVRTSPEDVSEESIVRIPVIGIGIVTPHLVVLTDPSGNERILFIDHFAAATYVTEGQVDELFAQTTEHTKSTE